MSDKEVKIGFVGKIIEGEAQGFYVYVKEDFEESGGYLILISREPTMSKDSEGYDYWAEDLQSLLKMFKGFKWKIDWLTE